MLLSAMLLAGCGDAKKSAGSDLSDAGYAVTEADFFRAVRANDVEALRKFHRAGFNLNAADEHGMEAIHQSAALGTQEAANWLLDRKVPVDRLGGGGRTPLMVAAAAGQVKMIDFLLRQGAKPALRDADGFKPIMLAVKEGHAGAVEALAPRSREDLDAALLLAAALGRTEVVDVLTRYGASVYSRMDDGRTALMLAAENGHAETVALLMDLGASRFAVNAEDQTAAQLAEAGGHPDVVAVLNALPTRNEASLPNLDGDPFALVANAGSAAASGNQVVSIQGVRLDSAAAIGSNGGASGATATGGGVTGGATTGPAGVIEMRAYRETALPIAFQKVTGSNAQVRLLFGKQQTVAVAAGDPIPNTSLRVVRVQRKFEASKLNGGQPMDVSILELEDTMTWSRREVIANHEASAHDPYAVLREIGSGRLLVAKPGQQFSTADGVTWTIIDVRPTQVVLERADGAGEPITLPLAGTHGKS
jgi:ankyrin repeat protein/predicted small secreted protein